MLSQAICNGVKETETVSYVTSIFPLMVTFPLAKSFDVSCTSQESFSIVKKRESEKKWEEESEG